MGGSYIMLKIHNTLTRKKEEFKPIHPPKVGMYVCGVTVYDDCHLGHARAVITFDVVYRYLKSLGYQVTYVRNFTDVDDKIINRAQKEKISWDQIASQYIASFYRDMDALGNQRPSYEPKATENIEAMQQMIKILEQKKMAYQAGGDVFYSVRQKTNYGKLSGKKIDELEAGSRIEVDEAKKDPLDFALWKGAKPGEPSWDSPWGKGRPGWHIECSAMSMKYLGETFDIHGGGRDLIFPHHENEIAQSEGATQKPFSNYWIHNGFININEEKMSKSLGNFLTIHELLKKYHPEVIRLFILAAHYRSPLDYTQKNIEATEQSLLRWYSTLARVYQSLEKKRAQKNQNPPKGLLQKINDLKAGFNNAMDDDFNTASVIGLLFDLVREWNKVLDEQESVDSSFCQAFLDSIHDIHSVLGVFGSHPKNFLDQHQERALISGGVNQEKIEEKIQLRNEARKNKDWGTSDAIRKELAELGVQIKDNPDGTTSWSMG